MSYQEPSKSLLNPVTFVTIKTPKDPLRRALAIAQGAKDAFSIGEAVVDGVVLYHYATGAKAMVGIP